MADLNRYVNLVRTHPIPASPRTHYQAAQPSSPLNAVCWCLSVVFKKHYALWSPSLTKTAQYLAVSWHPSTPTYRSHLSHTPYRENFCENSGFLQLWAALVRYLFARGGIVQNGRDIPIAMPACGFIWIRSWKYIYIHIYFFSFLFSSVKVEFLSSNGEIFELAE
jgi:hypothetical protein